MFLLDTNVISELRKLNTPAQHPRVRAWTDSVTTSQLYLSTITIFELEVGIQRLARKDLHQANVLRVWLNNTVLPSFIGRIISFDLPSAIAAASLHLPVSAAARDSFIAATAITHSFTIVTRNTKHFAAAGVPIINPWLFKP